MFQTTNQYIIIYLQIVWNNDSDVFLGSSVDWFKKTNHLQECKKYQEIMMFDSGFSKHALQTSTSVNKFETNKISSVSKMQKQEPPA